MIGPEKGTVEVIPHYASWRYAFEQKRPVLQEHIGDHGLDIEDVGGTGEGAGVAVVRGGAGRKAQQEHHRRPVPARNSRWPHILGLLAYSSGLRSEVRRRIIPACAGPSRLRGVAILVPCH
jgi:hypothetical protein